MQISAVGKTSLLFLDNGAFCSENGGSLRIEWPPASSQFSPVNLPDWLRERIFSHRLVICLMKPGGKLIQLTLKKKTEIRKLRKNILNYFQGVEQRQLFFTIWKEITLQ